MQEIRCCQCSKKLAVGEYVRLDIKCPRCKTMNYMRTVSPEPERHQSAK